MLDRFKEVFAEATVSRHGEQQDALSCGFGHAGLALGMEDHPSVPMVDRTVESGSLIFRIAAQRATGTQSTVSSGMMPKAKLFPPCLSAWA